MKRALIGAMLIALSDAPVLGAYWIDWDASDWPDALGYIRSWGNWQGPHQGGANRTLENGVLTYDSLYDSGVYDYYYMENFGSMDPGPNETFTCEWRLKVDVVNGDGDPGLALRSDDGWVLAYTYGEDHLRSIFEGYLSIPFEPGLWHEYQVVSWDMRSYDLAIDGGIVHHGSFDDVMIPGSYVAWGDGTQGAASLHHWDYVRFGVVPEARGFCLFVWVVAWRVPRRG